MYIFADQRSASTTLIRDQADHYDLRFREDYGKRRSIIGSQKDCDEFRQVENTGANEGGSKEDALET